MLLQLPDEFFRAVVAEELPPAGRLRRRGLLPAPRGRGPPRRARAGPRRRGRGRGAAGVAWRDVPMTSTPIGATAARGGAARQAARSSPPRPSSPRDRDAFERKLYVIRRVAEIAAGPELVIPSFSAKTIVYKGMLMAPQLGPCYPDLLDERMKSALVLIHSRFSTNTFPSWELAHPYRMIAHNGEINTVRGNVNWMRARESQLASELFGDDLRKVLPVVRAGGSDTANFDNVLELLVLAGRSLPARDDDDDPRGLRRPRRPARGAARLLRLPRLPDRAVGRPRLDLVHRRHRDRRHARPKRPAPGPLDRDEGRLGRARLRDRRARRAARERPAQGPAAAGEPLPGRPRAGPDRRGRRGEARRSPSAQALRRVVRATDVVQLARPPRARRRACPASSRCAHASSRSATRRRT